MSGRQLYEAKCREYGILKPISFIYPSNRVDYWSKVLLKKMGYNYAREGSSKYHNPRQDGMAASALIRAGLITAYL
ncbi:hypothetical protein [Pontibacter pamirensis]|uniref:hypothetical protein n=1 Tax=Pontibacter pamirensis TaxID=2562824 RepID=UPI001389A7D9|nr:hypothetical protein [Pontibacter pamirensis]